jgi:hypothetical protein
MITTTPERRRTRRSRCPNPHCGSRDGLALIAGTFRAEGVRFVRGHFNLRDATVLTTDDEVLRCLDCGATFSITRVL